MAETEGFQTMSRMLRWFFPFLYLTLFVGAFCYFEVDTFVWGLPFFQVGTFLLFFNVLFVMLVPPIVYMLCASVQPLWANRAARVGILVLNAVYVLLAAFLLAYKAVRGIDFDFYFFWYNTADTLPVLWKLYAPWFPVIALSLASFVAVQGPAFSPVMKTLRESPPKAGRSLAALFALSLLSQLATLHTIRGSTVGFLYASFLSDRRLRNEYRELYREEITALRSDAPTAVGDRGDASVLGDVIFFIKQESLSGLLVGPRITPQLLRAAQDGILFREFYGNSIQSLRGYECVLCGVPPNIAGALVDDYPASELNELSCLPRVFKALGYRPLYFFGGSRNARIMRFAESIGFEQVLADDIVQPGDIKFDWGYREDVFFGRVHEYLQRHHANDKLFVFIDTGATNHIPFEVLDDALVDRVPFPRSETFEEHLSNTTFVQDAYFGHFYDLFKEHYGRRGSLVVVSDHSWPIPIHKNNIYNERGAYEENFRIPLLFVPPSSQRERFATGTTVRYRFSQMDILPTVLDLIGLKQRRLLGESFAPWLLQSQDRERLAPRRTKISIQPYGGGFISALRYPKKYLFDVLGRNVKVFDLQKDPGEQSPVVYDAGEYTSVIRESFQTESRDR